MDNNKGLFITIEGPEGAGKTTQIKLLAQFFANLQKECLITREPGGTNLAEKLRAIIKHHNDDEPIFDETELLLIAAARSQHVRHVIAPAIKRGAVVICDRFYDSTTAYQGYARRISLEKVHAINSFSVGQCHPDLTIVLDVDPATSVKRITKRQESKTSKHDRFEAEDSNFHTTVRNSFLEIAKKFPQRVKVVTGNMPKENVHNQIVELVRNVI